MRSGILTSVIRSLIIMIFLGFSLVGADCSNLLNNNTDNIADVVGSWQLVSESGAQFDVCAGETVIFAADHIAQLQCPSQAPLTRTVTVTNGTITYQETGVQYNYTVDNTSSTTSQLSMTGVNVSRNLVYNKVIAASTPVATGKKEQNSHNSSDK